MNFVEIMGRKYFLATEKERILRAEKQIASMKAVQEGKVELNIYDGPFPSEEMIKADAMFHLKKLERELEIMLSEDKEDTSGTPNSG